MCLHATLINWPQIVTISNSCLIWKKTNGEKYSGLISYTEVDYQGSKLGDRSN